jgi:hypothetical protein
MAGPDVCSAVWRYAFLWLVSVGIGSFSSTGSKSILVAINLQLLSQYANLLLQPLVLYSQNHLTRLNFHLDKYSLQLLSLLPLELKFFHQSSILFIVDFLPFQIGVNSRPFKNGFFYSIRELQSRSCFVP